MPGLCSDQLKAFLLKIMDNNTLKSLLDSGNKYRVFTWNVGDSGFDCGEWLELSESIVMAHNNKLIFVSGYRRYYG